MRQGRMMTVQAKRLTPGMVILHPRTQDPITVTEVRPSGMFFGYIRIAWSSDKPLEGVLNQALHLEPNFHFNRPL